VQRARQPRRRGGDDTFVVNTWGDITINDTIDGGDGTDVVQSNAAAITLNSTATSSLKNMERIEITQAGATTVTITDAGIGSFNNDITINRIPTRRISSTVRCSVLHLQGDVHRRGWAETYTVATVSTTSIWDP